MPVSESGLEKQHACWLMNLPQATILDEIAKVMDCNNYEPMLTVAGTVTVFEADCLQVLSHPVTSFSVLPVCSGQRKQH